MKKYWFIGILLCLFIGFFILKTFMNRHTVVCPEINKTYSEWFPYNQDDILVFKNSDSTRLYEIKIISLRHTKSYQNNQKCGCCEEGIYILMIGQKDTIKIGFDNFNNPNSCMGNTRYINKNGINLNVKTTQNSDELKLNQISSDSLLLEKKYWDKTTYVEWENMGV